MGATQTRESKLLGQEYARRVTAQTYADMGDMNHATSYENKAAKTGYKADRMHARRFNRGKTPFPLAQHAFPAATGAAGVVPAGLPVGVPTMPLANEFIAGPTFVPSLTTDAGFVQQQSLMQEGFVPTMQAFETPMLNYQAPMLESMPMETIMLPPRVLPPIIAPMSGNYW